MPRLLLISLLAIFTVGCNLSDPQVLNNENNQNNENNENNENNGSDVGDRDMAIPNNQNNNNDAGRDVAQEDAAIDMGVTPLTLIEYCDEQGSAWVNELFNCYSYGPYEASFYDPAGPNAVRQWQYNCRAAQADIDAGTMTFDGTQAAICAEAMRAGIAECTWGNEPRFQLDECENVFAGIAPPGTSCFRNEECTDDHYCSRNVCPGSCTRFQQVGETCDTDPCNFETAYCDFNQAPQVCVAFKPAGTACDQNFECEDGFCLGGTCRGWADHGEACSDNTPCRSGEVVPPANTEVLHLCINDVCRFKSVAAGPCLYDYQCGVGEWCNRPDSTELGSCDALPTLNQACANGFQCEAGLYCNANNCEDAANLNEICVNARPCADPNRVFCMDDGRCHVPGLDGEPCAVDRRDSCTIGLVCDPLTSVCGPRAADGDRCNPGNGNGENFFEGLNTPGCQDGLACLCLTPNCPQNDINERHACSPIADATLIPCRNISECPSTSYCDENSQFGFPNCRDIGTCHR